MAPSTPKWNCKRQTVQLSWCKNQTIELAAHYFGNWLDPCFFCETGCCFQLVPPKSGAEVAGDSGGVAISERRRIRTLGDGGVSTAHSQAPLLFAAQFPCHLGTHLHLSAFNSCSVSAFVNVTETVCVQELIFNRSDNLFHLLGAGFIHLRTDLTCHLLSLSWADSIVHLLPPRHFSDGDALFRTKFALNFTFFVSNGPNSTAHFHHLSLWGRRLHLLFLPPIPPAVFKDLQVGRRSWWVEQTGVALFRFCAAWRAGAGRGTGSGR